MQLHRECGGRLGLLVGVFTPGAKNSELARYKGNGTSGLSSGRRDNRTGHAEFARRLLLNPELTLRTAALVRWCAFLAMVTHT